MPALGARHRHRPAQDRRPLLPTHPRSGWTQQDTLDNIAEPANGNRYTYTGEDPMNNIAPAAKTLSPPSLAVSPAQSALRPKLRQLVRLNFLVARPPEQG